MSRPTPSGAAYREGAEVSPTRNHLTVFPIRVVTTPLGPRVVDTTAPSDGYAETVSVNYGRQIRAERIVRLSPL